MSVEGVRFCETIEQFMSTHNIRMFLHFYAEQFFEKNSKEWQMINDICYNLQEKKPFTLGQIFFIEELLSNDTQIRDLLVKYINKIEFVWTLDDAEKFKRRFPRLKGDSLNGIEVSAIKKFFLWIICSVNISYSLDNVSTKDDLLWDVVFDCNKIAWEKFTIYEHRWYYISILVDNATGKPVSQFHTIQHAYSSSIMDYRKFDWSIWFLDINWGFLDNIESYRVYRKSWLVVINKECSLNVVIYNISTKSFKEIVPPKWYYFHTWFGIEQGSCWENLLRVVSNETWNTVNYYSLDSDKFILPDNNMKILWCPLVSEHRDTFLMLSNAGEDKYFIYNIHNWQLKELPCKYIFSACVISHDWDLFVKAAMFFWWDVWEKNGKRRSENYISIKRLFAGEPCFLIPGDVYNVWDTKHHDENWDYIEYHVLWAFNRLKKQKHYLS